MMGHAIGSVHFGPLKNESGVRTAWKDIVLGKDEYRVVGPACCCETKECDCDKRWLKVERK